MKGPARFVWVCSALVWLAGGCAAPSGLPASAPRWSLGVAAKEETAKPKPAPRLSGRLTLAQAVKLALAGNPDRAGAIARIRAAEAEMDRAAAAFWPRVGLFASYTMGDAPSAYLFKTIDQRTLAPNTDFNRPGHFTNFEYGVSLGWNIFRGGVDYLNRRMAATGVGLARLGQATLENALLASVLKGFYNCLAARDFAAIAGDSVKTVAAQLKVMRVRFAAGGVLRSDLLSLEVRLAQAKEELVRAANNYQMALAALATLLGADPDSNYRPEPGGKGCPKPPVQYRRGLMVALAKRPELAAARLKVVKARLAARAATAGYLPRLDANIRAYKDGGNIGESGDANWTGGLMLNWTLFSGLSTRAKQAAAAALLKEMNAAAQKSVLAVRLDVRSAYLRLKAARARKRVSTASVAQAEESLKLVRRQYEGGSAGVTRYLDAELALSRARFRAAAACHDIAKATADLGRALGLLVESARKGALTK